MDGENWLKKFEANIASTEVASPAKDTDAHSRNAGCVSMILQELPR
jgi:hypothetical protein